MTEEQMRDLVKECGLDWQRGYMPLFDGDPTNRYAVLICAALEQSAGIPQTADAELASMRAECARLHAEAAKSERRAIAFGDIVNSHVVAMRAAVVAAKLEGLDVGMQWIANTLCGPGQLPDIDEARALGGAQALWDKETAEHEAFRAAHPAP